MAEFTPPNQPPGIDVISRYDASEGWAAGMDRKIRKEEAVEETIKNFIVMAQHDSQLAERDDFITEAARALIDKLKKIDNGKA